MTKVKLDKTGIAILLIVIALIIAIAIPITLILGNQEISNPEIFSTLTLFSIFAILGSIIVLAIFFLRSIWRQDNKYGDGFGFVNLGEYPAISQFSFIKKLGYWRTTLWSLLIIGGTFLIVNLTKVLGTGFFGNKVLPVQQFTKFQSLAFSSLLVPMSEELFSLAIVGFLVILLIFVAVRYNMSKTSFRTYYFLLIPLILGILAVVWHSSAYPGSQIALLTVFFFWFIKTLFILATGFFIVGWVLHFMNNFSLSFSQLYSSDALTGWAIGFLVVIMILLIVPSISKKSKKGG